MTIKIIILSLYAFIIIAVGIMGLRRARTFQDFFLGGGKIGPWMSAFTYGTAYFSAVLFIGFAGKIGWSFGLSGIWIAVGNSLIGVLGVWFFLGNRIKKMSVDYKVSTMAEYFEKRYDSKFLKVFASIAIFVFFIPYSAAVFMGLSYLFESNFGLDYWVSLVFMGAFTAVYLVLGGYKSMTIIDVFFGVIMAVGVIVLLSSTLNSGGGLDGIMNNLSLIDPKLKGIVGPPGFWPLFCLIFLTSVAPFAMPQLVQKFYAIKDKRSINIGMVASTLFAVLIGGTAYFVGSTTRIFLSPEVSPNAFGEEGRPVFDALIPELLVKVIPNSLSVLLLLVILSASMSTLAALVLISSSSVAKDMYHPN